MNFRRILARSIATLGVLIGGEAMAASLTWDLLPGTVGAGDGAVTGGSGTWNTTLGNWTANGGTTNVAWANNAVPDAAVFGGAAGTVTLGTAITANGDIVAFAAYANVNRQGGVIADGTTSNVRIVEAGAGGNITLGVAGGITNVTR